MGFNCYAVHCIVNREETPKTVPSPWDFITLPEEDVATATGNMHEKMVKIARAVPARDMLAVRQTDTHTDVLITILRRKNREVTGKTQERSGGFVTQSGYWPGLFAPPCRNIYQNIVL